MNLPLNVTNAFYRVSIKAVIIQDGQLVLVRERAETWDLPGGGLDHGEDIEAGLRRELGEELHVDLASFQPQPMFIWTMPNTNRQTGEIYWLMLIGYQVIPASYDFQATDDVAETGWFSPQKLASLPLDPPLVTFREKIIGLLQ